MTDVFVVDGPGVRRYEDRFTEPVRIWFEWVPTRSTAGCGHRHRTPLAARICGTPPCLRGGGTYRGTHWWAVYGFPGSTAPTCRHCGAPNPRYDPDLDPYARSL